MSALYLTALVGAQRVAFDAAHIGSVIDLAEISPVPLAPAHIAGLSAVRSQVLTVIDLAVSMGEIDAQPSSRAVVVEIDEHSYALRVSSVEDVVPSIGDHRPIDASIGDRWCAVAVATIELASGLALLLDPAKIVGRPADSSA